MKTVPLYALSVHGFSVRRPHAATLSLSAPADLTARDGYSLFWCMRGSARVSLGTQEWVLEGGSVLLLAPSTPSSWIPVTDTELLVVRAELFDIDAASAALSDLPMTVTADADLAAALLALLDGYRHCAEQAALCRMAYDAFRALSRVGAVHALGGILPALDYIHAHLDADVRVETLAELSGMCESSLRREFAHRLGMSPKAYILQRKLERAADMLISGLYTIKEICTLLGFWDDAYFSKLFKRHTGLTPMQYAREHSGV